MPFSLSRTASSTAISSNGFIDILTLAVSTPEPSGLTRTLTLKSTTRLMGVITFIFYVLGISLVPAASTPIKPFHSDSCLVVIGGTGCPKKATNRRGKAGPSRRVGNGNNACESYPSAGNDTFLGLYGTLGHNPCLAGLGERSTQ